MRAQLYTNVLIYITESIIRLFTEDREREREGGRYFSEFISVQLLSFPDIRKEYVGEEIHSPVL